MKARNTLTRRLKTLGSRARGGRETRGRPQRRAENCVVGVANDLESRRKAYRVVYELYLEKEYAEPNASRMWVSSFDALAGTTTLLAEDAEDGTPVGALTAVSDSPAGLPADSLYRPELDALRASGRRLCEIISLGVDSRAARGTEVLVKLFNHVYLLARRIRGATDFVITVNPRHAGFYQKTLLFTAAGPGREYDKVGGAPALLMRLDLAVPEEQLRLEHGRAERRPARSRTLYRLFCPPAGEPGIIRSLARWLRPMSRSEMAYFLPHRYDRPVAPAPEAPAGPADEAALSASSAVTGCEAIMYL
jgi:hypothetical protein